MNSKIFKLVRIRFLLVLVCFFCSEVMAQATQQQQLSPEQQVRVMVKDALIERVIGISQVSSLSSSIEDFLPDFQLASFLQGGDTFGGSDQVVIDLAQLLYSDQVKSNNIKLKAVFNRNPDLSPDVATFFGDDQSGMLSEQIGETDDYEVSFSYSYVNDRFGRNYSAYLGDFSDLSLNLLNLENTHSKAKKDLTAYLIKMSLQERKCEQLLDRNADPICKGFEFDEVEVERRLQAELDTLATLSLQTGVNRFSDLVSNQPQLILSGKYRIRDELVGQDEFSVQLKYEHGFANLNRYKKFRCQDLDENQVLGLYEILNFACYINNERTHAALDAGDRVFASIEYISVDDQNLSFNEQAFFKRGGDKLIATLGYGRSLTKGIFRNARVDVSVNWEEFLGDTEGEDRAVASLIYTKKLGKNISLPITLQIANKSEFLADDTSQFGGHIGIKYDFSEINL